MYDPWRHPAFPEQETIKYLILFMCSVISMWVICSLIMTLLCFGDITIVPNTYDILFILKNKKHFPKTLNVHLMKNTNQEII